MQQPNSGIDERSQLNEKLWSFAQRGVVLLVAVLVGLYIGYWLWGQAGALKEQVAQLQQKVNLREKERDTLKSQMALIDRDKKEVERRLQDLQARCAAPAEAVQGGQPAGGAPPAAAPGAKR
jgi:cell division protein FtsB